MNEAELQRLLDRTKTAAFRGNNSAFLGSLLISLDFRWDEKIPTACTNGLELRWNPTWFMSLTEPVRKTVLLHELWHIARLHIQRVGSRDPKVWNYACDIRINNDLKKEGHSFKDVEWCWMDPNVPDDEPEEDIYERFTLLPPPKGSAWSKSESGDGAEGGADFEAPGGDGDGDDPSKDGRANSAQQNAQIVNNVVRALQQAQLAGQAGNLPGAIRDIINKFLTPVVPWEQVLHKWMSDLQDEDYTWARPNRRFQGMYLPSRFTDDGRLEKLNYYLDVSGSISNRDVLRFNSEVKHVKEGFQPQEMKIIQFDTIIQDELIIEEGDAFDEIKVARGGGTCLKCVKRHIDKDRPTAAIIFSDMYVLPMEALEFDIPVLWVVLGKGGHQPNFGEVVRIPNGT